MILGVDTGGTFTDFVWFDGDRVRVHKVLSTPDAPERAILQGMQDLGIDAATVAVVHGSTVATNAVLEGKGVSTVFITNRGFADMLTIGRQAREKLYELQPARVDPPVVPEYCLETGGRLDAQGNVISALTDADLKELRRAVERLQPESVAINLLYSYLDDAAEKRIADCLPGTVFVSRSSEVLPEVKEYERGMATWLNAWIGPLVEGYIRRLAANFADGTVSIMQSSGETVSAEQAARYAVRMLLSGPAGGLQGARYACGLSGASRLLSFDMGGTSTDVALIDGEPTLTSDGHIGTYPVAVPMVDMHTIGAGGGSIAHVDEGGMLLVGPQSAGADPGPACYARGGRQVTVTDANLVLGRLLPTEFLGGQMILDRSAALSAMNALAREMGTDVETAAAGVIEVANEHMARALRAIAIRKGVDHRDYALVSFGGAGGLHVCALAQKLGMRRAMVPVMGGVLSALGMLVARPGRQLSHTWVNRVDETNESDLLSRLSALEEEGRMSLLEDGIPEHTIEHSPSLEMRYVGQAYTLNVPSRGLVETVADFHRMHEALYGHRLEAPVEIVTLRQAVTGQAVNVRLPEITNDSPGDAVTYSRLSAMSDEVPVYRRQMLAAGQELTGPCIVVETVSTTWIDAGWTAVLDQWGNLLLEATD